MLRTRQQLRRFPRRSRSGMHRFAGAGLHRGGKRGGSARTSASLRPVRRPPLHRIRAGHVAGAGVNSWVASCGVEICFQVRRGGERAQFLEIKFVVDASADGDARDQSEPCSAAAFNAWRSSSFRMRVSNCDHLQVKPMLVGRFAQGSVFEK